MSGRITNVPLYLSIKERENGMSSKSKKLDTFGQLSLLDPNWQARNILTWIGRGNKHLLTERDKQRLSVLIDRVTDDSLKEWASDLLSVNQ